MKAPFPWFGGKARAADLIWSRFGDVENYIEPFAGSLAVLLARPHWPFVGPARTETVNDIDAYVVNFWRALEADPEAVTAYADNPVNECDLHARHAWLHRQAERVEALKVDPDWYDARIAGYWAWGLSSWIGDNFCRPSRQDSLPHLGDPGKGAAVPGGCDDRRQRLLAYFLQLADRLRGVRVCCGDWMRVLTPSVTFRHGVTGILLDPPYDVGGTEYGESAAGISSAVRAWAIENGGNPLLRIALCGYADEGHAEAMPEGWMVEAWKAGGGYNNLSSGVNRTRERIWFSPACRRTGLFEVVA